MKILFIACYSPLINNSAAIETLQYLNKLSGIPGNEIHLLTVNFPENSIYYDEYLFSMMDSKIKYHLIDGGVIFKKFIPRKQSIANVNKEPIKNRKFLRKIKNAFVIPDMYYGWAKKAAKYGIQLMQQEKFDVMFSMHEPPSSHLCAYYIKRKFKNVPWITYWSDPWLKDSTRQNSFVLKRLVEKNMEKNVVQIADKFIFVTEENRKDYLSQYKAVSSKGEFTYILNRGFDKELYNKLSLESTPKLINKNKINMVYTGEIFTKLRNINPFIEALEEIKDENKDDYELLNILFFGNIDDIEVKRKLSNLEIAKVSCRIPFDEALKYMLNSEILLLFGNKNSKQIPAKIYDYFGTDARIFVIYGDNNDPIKDIVENNKKCINTNNSVKEIKDNIYRLIGLYKSNDIKSEPDYRYEWNSIVKKLNTILEEK
ncbi:glycosyltransferase family 4 protein [Clostridium botulinum]|uniref:glycosyl transferase group 1 n=1 Tax=Clostridium botulinum TaxID=1491 RepID=UPI0013F128AD|nr:glycosyl transferase group 1 [Clostridium botulinum]MCS6110085.1 glycosyl transferase group 1 [Clostridium botulinum]NFE13416.1 glycosyltransferase family 4 protein [Clostridium botulinum]NFG26134.1 glycosyltransferase family 4 protein [Clostridium botulinum]NFL40869.1 glycosyltransferase family 4 protein [Clostridium botulinum]NFN21215.1 glycosyltransferase family 4 protein [Clostridium botulinum]